MTQHWQWAFVVVVGVIFACVIFVRMAAKEDREEERLRKLQRAQYDNANAPHASQTAPEGTETYLDQRATEKSEP